MLLYKKLLLMTFGTTLVISISYANVGNSNLQFKAEICWCYSDTDFNFSGVMIWCYRDTDIHLSGAIC